MNLENELLGLIREKAYEKKNIVLASGRLSDFYIDLKNVLLHPKGISLVGQLLLKRLKKYEGRLVGVGGPSIGADPLVTAVSMLSLEWQQPLMGFYIRKQLKDHGTGQWIEGTKNLPKGSKVFVLEDVVTSGGSSLVAVQKAREAGFDVVGIICVVDREEGGRTRIEAEGLEFLNLFSKSDIV